MKFNPILQAPKDGRRVLLYYRIGEREKFVVGRWNEDKYAKKPRPYWTNDGELLYGIKYTRDVQPTHYADLEFEE